MARRTLIVWLLLFGLIAGAACDSAQPSDAGDGEPEAGESLDADRDDGDRNDGEEDVLPEGGSGAPGPLTYVSSSIEAIPDRLCDLDGDGVGDNAFSDLGNPHTAVFLQIVNVSMDASLSSGVAFLMHLPLVEDAETPEDSDTLIILSRGEDEEEPDDPSDDFSGEETFYAAPNSLDACGEPLFFDPHGSIENGSLAFTQVSYPLDIGGPVTLITLETTGFLEPGGAGGWYESCGYNTIRDLGDNTSAAGGTEHTLLEVFVAGGAAADIPSLPGLDPDLDLDGDGLERFVLDDEGRIASCIDGDTTIIEGRDCWMDPRIGDAFSFNIRIELVGAELLGPEPGWEDRVEGTCDDPPAHSLWDPT